MGHLHAAQDVPKITHRYVDMHDELSTENGLLIKDERIGKPTALCDQLLADLHEGHTGVSKSQQQATTTVSWPGINTEIADYTNQCQTCTDTKPSRPTEHSLNHPVSASSWHKLGMEFFHIFISDLFHNCRKFQQICIHHLNVDHQNHDSMQPAQTDLCPVWYIKATGF